MLGVINALVLRRRKLLLEIHEDKGFAIAQQKHRLGRIGLPITAIHWNLCFTSTGLSTDQGKGSCISSRRWASPWVQNTPPWLHRIARRIA